MDFVAAYFRDLHAIRASGNAVSETSFYPALAALLNATGAGLRPRVHCILTLKNRGAGIPDGGLFTDDQISRHNSGNAFPAPLPARGVIEVKGAGTDVGATARSPQVQKYLDRYGQVLVTNYRDFLLVGRDSQGRALPQERYCLAENETDFWRQVSNPADFADAHRERFVEYLKRVLLGTAPLRTPTDVAWFLASYARDARARVEAAKLPALDQVRSALEQALGISFDERRGEHFFRSTLIQTLFYGVFAAWVLWHHENPDREDRFDWRLAQHYLHVPVLQELFAQLSIPVRLQPLGLIEVLDWTGAALNRVERAEFFARFDAGQAVQYFYEPFLAAFDPELRKELGVWYTPPEVVRYMVARVDAALREELGVADGLADPNVVVLDPCTGTGAFIAEVLRCIAATLQAKGEDVLAGQDVKRAALSRVFGFELLPAPFVIAHLQIGLLLQQLGAPLGKNERAGVYLTNALTGWTSPNNAKQAVQLSFPGLPELQNERDQAEQIKRDARILVILGNPPYSGYAGISRIDEERDLSHAYRSVRRAPAPQGQGLNDLYVRFFRMAERQIVEKTGRGVICFISNYSWLDGLSFTGMRERYLEVFDRIWIDNLHGDRIISEYAPDGRTSETIFAMDKFSPGIKIGTAITLMVKAAKSLNGNPAKVLYRDFEQARASERRSALLDSLNVSGVASAYRLIIPKPEIGLPFKPRVVGENCLTWPRLPDLFPVSFPGVKTSRDNLVVDIDRERLLERMRQYFDPKISHADLARLMPAAMERSARFDPVATRDYLLKCGFCEQNVVRYCYRPFDIRWLYWEPETKLLDEKRSEYFSHVFEGNVWIEARQKQAMEEFDRGYVTCHLADNFGNGLSSFFPLYLSAADHPRELFDPGAAPGRHDRKDGKRLNLSAAALAYLDKVGCPGDAEALFYHTLAVLHAPAYRAENAGALRQDWPRIPLPATGQALQDSAKLGREVAALIDSERPVPGVTTGAIRAELRHIAMVSRIDNTPINPAAGDLDVTAGWGYAGRGGITMPGKGRVVERKASADEANPALGLGADSLTYDIYLNERVYWRNVPPRVWTYTMGGYRVLKKWLSYRERPLLSRSLRVDEVREVTAIARRIAALLMLGPELDKNYRAVTADACPLGDGGAP